MLLSYNLMVFFLIILVGTLCYLLSRRIKIPLGLLLLATGFLLGYIIQPVFQPEFMYIITIIAVIMAAFDLGNMFKIKGFDSLTRTAIEISLTTSMISVILITSILRYALNFSTMESYLLTVMLCFFIVEVSAVNIYNGNESQNKKVDKLLHHEASIVPFLIIILPFLFLSAFDLFFTGNAKLLVNNIIYDILVSLGAGILIGILSIKLMKNIKNYITLHIMLLCVATLSFFLGELLGGNGILSVLVFGFFFGNTYIKEHYQLESFSPVLSNFLEIFIYITIGMYLRIDDINLVFISMICYIIYLASRYICISIFNPCKEKLYFTLNSPKGSITIVSLLFFYLMFNYTLNLPTEILDLANNIFIIVFLVSVYSMIISWMSRLIKP